MVRNRSIDNHRLNRRGDSLQTSNEYLETVPASESVEADAIRQDESRRLRALLQQLPVLQREVIVLAYFGGLSHTEIGKHLDVPLGTVKGRMRLGLMKIAAKAQAPPPRGQDLAAAA